MDSVKIIFFDIDGTLIAKQSQGISPRLQETLHRLRAKGIRLCIATGRGPFLMPDFGDLEFDAFLNYNGALCHGPQGVIYRNPLTPEAVDRVIQNATALGRPVSLATDSYLSANGWDQDLADYYAIPHLTLTLDPNFSEARKKDIYQVMLGCREKDHAAILEGVPGVRITCSWDRAADVIPASGGKGSAIGKVLAHFGLKPEEAIAFGDGENDMDMLRAVGTGVAMGNAVAPLKAVADAVCLPVTQDGIYHFCLERGLI